MLLSASNLCLLLLDMYLPLSHSSIPCHYACRSPHFNSRVWSKSDLGMASVIFTFKFDAVSKPAIRRDFDSHWRFRGFKNSWGIVCAISYRIPCASGHEYRLYQG
ncbi:hypothetical protein L208DRAFT_771703 [Tricholoma matsutake]|nr:hypothetical protein L208DRAFT_771703 [Tricholoma matsutake 945]